MQLPAVAATVGCAPAIRKAQGGPAYTSVDREHPVHMGKGQEMQREEEDGTDIY